MLRFSGFQSSADLRVVGSLFEGATVAQARELRIARAQGDVAGSHQESNVGEAFEGLIQDAHGLGGVPATFFGVTRGSQRDRNQVVQGCELERAIVAGRGGIDSIEGRLGVGELGVVGAVERREGQGLVGEVEGVAQGQDAAVFGEDNESCFAISQSDQRPAATEQCTGVGGILEQREVEAVQRLFGIVRTQQPETVSPSDFEGFGAEPFRKRGQFTIRFLEATERRGRIATHGQRSGVLGGKLLERFVEALEPEQEPAALGASRFASGQQVLLRESLDLFGGGADPADLFEPGGQYLPGTGVLGFVWRGLGDSLQNPFEFGDGGFTRSAGPQLLQRCGAFRGRRQAQLATRLDALCLGGQGRNLRDGVDRLSQRNRTAG